MIPNEPDFDKCECEPLTSFPFLDAYLSIENGKIKVDLYIKRTDRNQYLLQSSCHPKTTKKAIPYSLSLRIVLRTCTKPEIKDQRLKDFKELLMAREYTEPNK